MFIDSSKITVVMQPTLFPWIGYFDLVDQSDTFIFYDDVQFVKRSWQSRNRISTLNGILMISIQTDHCAQSTKIKDVNLNKHHDWNKKTLKTIKENYVKTRYFNEIYTWLESFLIRDFNKLEVFNTTFITEISSKLGIKTVFKRSSEINLDDTDRINRLIDLTTNTGSNIYLSTPGSFGYLNDENADKRFKEKNIDLMFHNYIPIKYETGKLPFEPYMSIIDVLFHCGFEQTLSIIKAGRKPSFLFDQYKKLNNNE